MVVFYLINSNMKMITFITVMVMVTAQRYLACSSPTISAAVLFTATTAGSSAAFASVPVELGS